MARPRRDADQVVGLIAEDLVERGGIAVPHHRQQLAERARVLCELDEPVREPDVPLLVRGMRLAETALVLAVRVDRAVAIAGRLGACDALDERALVVDRQHEWAGAVCGTGVAGVADGSSSERYGNSVATPWSSSGLAPRVVVA